MMELTGDRGSKARFTIRPYAFTIPANPMSDRGQLVLMRYYKAISWSRDSKGVVQNYNLRDVVNCLTTMCGGGHTDPKTGMGNTTPHILIRYEERG